MTFGRLLGWSFPKLFGGAFGSPFERPPGLFLGSFLEVRLSLKCYRLRRLLYLMLVLAFEPLGPWKPMYLMFALK